jgi:chromosome segregation ATPase
MSEITINALESKVAALNEEMSKKDTKVEFLMECIKRQRETINSLEETTNELRTKNGELWGIIKELEDQTPL